MTFCGIDGETAENNPEIEAQWAVLAFEFAEAHYSQLLCTKDAKTIKFSNHDSELLEAYMANFQDIALENIDEMKDFKSQSAKEKWRAFHDSWKHIPDYNFGTMLRNRTGEDYGPSNAFFCTRLQFYCIELARNHFGHNASTYDPSAPVMEEIPKYSLEDKIFSVDHDEHADSIQELESMLDNREKKAPSPKIQEIPSFSCEELNAKSIKELKQLMEANNISSSGCVERADLIQKLLGR